MTRIMGDATSSAARSLVAYNPDIFAIYVTGSPSIMWTAAQRALIPAGKTIVTIDQGYTGSPVLDANVRDVEAGAWTMAAAVNRTGWTVKRPTLYFSESLLVRRFMTTKMRQHRVERRLKGAFSAGWRGDVWVAMYDGVPRINFAVPAGINVVAKQYTDTTMGGNVDSSVVFDPTWPEEDPIITIPGIPGFWLSVQILSSADGTKQVAIGLGTDGALWQVVRSGGTWGAPTPV